MKRVSKTTVAILVAGILPAVATADLTKHDKENIVTNCKKEIKKKGYGEGYTYKFIEVMEIDYGGYTMTGQIHKDSKHFGFNCLFDKKQKFTDIAIDPISK
ncbi:hypothetical protein MNB_SV-6-1457 [hydrothermal vent metagenome]|uniref:Uncharacterized protein n=1 Tax=hydrothermal vent metagenome TaxID=652676 RepID=A0A1W1BC29_9ZZZZ